MVDLVFDCVGASADRYAAGPGMTLRLRIAETTGAQVSAIALRCQIRIEPQRRRYSSPHCPQWSPASPATPSTTCRSSAPTTSRSRRPSTSAG